MLPNGSGSYERDLRDVLTLHAEVAQAIAQEIQVKIAPQERTRLAQVHPVDPQAYEAYLKGRYYWNRRSGKGIGKAIQVFQEAIAKDPTYAAAYSGLADCLTLVGSWGAVAPADGCAKAKALALEALAIDSSLAEAHASLAWATMWYDYDFESAEREFERSLNSIRAMPQLMSFSLLTRDDWALRGRIHRDQTGHSPRPAF